MGRKTLICCDKGSFSAPSSSPRMGMYAKYTPIRVDFDLAPSLTPSNNKYFAVIRGHRAVEGRCMLTREFREIREFRESSAHKVRSIPKLPRLLKLPKHYQCNLGKEQHTASPSPSLTSLKIITAKLPQPPYKQPIP